ncbi:MAG: hypothetical protein JW864_17365 [Spirochaetes bacterium]|nr:hypothetical protein [Spirochaetota bacterium]
MKPVLILSKIFLSLSFVLLFSLSSAFALSEAELDNQLLADTGQDESINNAYGKSPWQIFGFIESLNQFYIPDNASDEPSDYKVIKLEGHGRMNAKYETGSYYGKAVIDVYFYPNNADENSEEDWDPPRESRSIEAQEIYLKGGEKFQFRIGKQLFSWGAADMFQITNYFDQADQREFFAIDKDERYEGVPALSLQYLFGNFSVEVAGTPVHNPALMPEEGSFWHLSNDPVSTPVGDLPVVIKDTDKLPSSINNASYAVRAGGTAGTFDFHLSYYNGINSNILYKPELTGTSQTLSDASIEMQQYYDRIQEFGLDLAFTFDKLSVRGEALYSPDMLAVKKPDEAAMQAGLTALMMGAGSPGVEISPVEDAGYASYVVGADYNLWGNNGLILVEWMQSMYLENEDEYQEPFINKMLYVRLEDKLFNEFLEVEAGTIIRPIEKEFGYTVTGELMLNFKNGLTVSAGGFSFVGKQDDLFSMFEDKDMGYLKARMTF